MEADSETLQQKIDALNRYSDKVISAVADLVDA
jgi:hypothetical protein